MSRNTEANLVHLPLPSGPAEVLDVVVLGDGVMGRTAALQLARAGRSVTLVGASLMHPGVPRPTSRHAGGMLAPVSELSHAEPELALAGLDSVQRWQELLPGSARPEAACTIHLAHRPEWPLLDDLMARINRADLGHRARWLDHRQLAEALPAVGTRFERALEITGEASVDPLAVMDALDRALEEAGVERREGYATPGSPTRIAGAPVDAALVVDARGLGSSPDLPLRGVRGEYAMVRTASVSLPHPVRLSHPRFPLYIVPRANHRFYVGATQFESESTDKPSVRSTLELLSALHSVHPGFGDAEVIRMGQALRPAMPDNLPVVRQEGHILRVNGLFRHGYLLAPLLADTVVAMAEQVEPPAAARPFIQELPCAS